MIYELQKRGSIRSKIKEKIGTNASAEKGGQ